MSKKSIVNEIIEKLKSRNVPKDGCANLNIELSNGNKLSWVGYRQVMVSIHINGAVFKNKRYPLYSKSIDERMLKMINSKL